MTSACHIVFVVCSLYCILELNFIFLTLSYTLKAIGSVVFLMYFHVSALWLEIAYLDHNLTFWGK